MSTADYADVAIKPPLLFLGALAMGCLLSLVVPIGPRFASPNGLALTVGLILVAVGLAIAVFSVRVFWRAGTNVVPGQPSTALVTAGPYAVTRNPIYIGFMLVYFGLAIMLTSVWVLLLIVPVAIILQRGVVAPEEAYLESKFGDAFSRYKARVPRWL